MSFLLRTKKRSGTVTPQGGTMPRSSAANFARPSFGRTMGGGGGQAQAMLQRPQSLRTKQKQSIVSKQQVQQPQQQTMQQQNVISMEEGTFLRIASYLAYYIRDTISLTLLPPRNSHGRSPNLGTTATRVATSVGNGSPRKTAPHAAAWSTRSQAPRL